MALVDRAASAFVAPNYVLVSEMRSAAPWFIRQSAPVAELEPARAASSLHSYFSIDGRSLTPNQAAEEEPDIEMLIAPTPITF